MFSELRVLSSPVILFCASFLNSPGSVPSRTGVCPQPNRGLSPTSQGLSPTVQGSVPSRTHALSHGAVPGCSEWVEGLSPTSQGLSPTVQGSVPNQTRTFFCAGRRRAAQSSLTAPRSCAAARQRSLREIAHASPPPRPRHVAAHIRAWRHPSVLRVCPQSHKEKLHSHMQN